jgi:hypothetical protein
VFNVKIFKNHLFTQKFKISDTILKVVLV